jgi:LysM repeat protein
MEVRPGDTLSDLAQWFGVSARSIAAANGAGVEDFIQIGDMLVIPVAESEFVMPPEPAPPTDPPTPAPEPTIVITPTPTPFVVSGPQDVIDAICSFPWPCDQMVRIATCESGLNPNAFNPAGYYGLFQINHEFDGWNDPLVNSKVAYETKYLPALSGGDPFVAWPACRHY